MNNVDVSFQLKEFKNEIQQLIVEVKALREKTIERELWDNADLIKYWKVSSRTLATWRAEGLISYVQLAGKIWYPWEAREVFLKSNLVNSKKEGDRNGFKN